MMVIPSSHRCPASPSSKCTLPVLLGGLALMGAGWMPATIQAANTSACMGIRPALYAGSAPTFVHPGQEIMVHGTGLLNYRNPVVVVSDERHPGQELRIAARVKDDGALIFTYPTGRGPSAPVALRAHVEDDTIIGSPAVCAAVRHDSRGRQILERFYAVATDAGCGDDPVVCPAAQDRLRSLTAITLNLIPPSTPSERMATVRIDRPSGMASPFCDEQPVVSEVAAFLDAGQDGTSAGFSKVSMRPPSASEEPIDETTPRVGNLMVVARFQSCNQQEPWFVAAHFVMTGPADIPVIEPVKLTAGYGSEAAESAGKPRQGVVLSGEIRNQRIRLASATTIEGSVSGLVTQIPDSTARGALVHFNFRVPVEAR